MILKRICRAIKSSAREALLIGALFSSSLGVVGCGNSILDKNQEMLSPSSVSLAAPTIISEPNEVRKISKPNDARKNPPFITTVYGEGGVYRDAFHENPFLLNITTGFNILDKELEDGVLYLPSLRVLLRADERQNPWNRRVDIGIGAAYQKSPFIIGIEGVHREKFDEERREGDFLRLWGGYWDMWEKKPLEQSKTNPNRLWGTKYAEFEYNTLEKNLIGIGRADAVLDMFNLGGFIAGPYVSGKVNLDTESENWNRFGEVAAGIRVRKGILNLFVESGYRGSFNEGIEGQYNALYGGFWFRF